MTATLPAGMPRSLVVRHRLVSGRVRARLVGVTAVLALVCVVLSVVALGLGEIRISAVDVVRALVSPTDPVQRMLVTEWRLPRIELALLLGAALGVAGAVMQSLTHNPLGSPDIIGFDAGAYTGAILTIVAVGSTAAVIPGAVVGGLVTAVVVYLLAYRQGVAGFRLIVIGIAVTAMLGALNAYLLLKSDLWTAQMAAIWGAGSLNGLDQADVRVAVPALALMAVPILLARRAMSALELGDDAARAAGIAINRNRLLLMFGAVGCSAVVTALAGPIAFVALAAPQLVRRLTRAPGVQLVPAAAMGATLLLACDLVALHAFPAVLPVGLLTVVLGGAYLIWLLIVQSRQGWS